MTDVPVSEVARFARDALRACAVPQDQAEIIVDSIVFAHSTGKGTHGLGRLPIYVRKLRGDLMAADTPLREVMSAPAVALLDAAHGFGQVAGIRGMQRAAEMARICGIGLVGIRHSNNFGTAAFIVNAAVEAGMMGIVLSNAAPAIAPSGGKTPVFGTNPMAFGFPGAEGHPPILLDMATSQAARGKIRLAAANGEAIPEGWALDAHGNPTTDAEAALKGSMIPVGGAKGYGLSLAVDILAGLLTGSGFGGGAKNLDHPDAPSDCGHLLVAIDIAKFMDPEEYQADIATLTTATKAAGKAGAVVLPGERAGRFMDGRDGGVPLSRAILEKCAAVADDLDIAPLQSGVV
jgi:L-2-hydroxycarboxylate dehydrogenase (NAD+)